MSQGQTLGPDQIGRVRTGYTNDPDTRTHQADREHAADCPGTENRDRHVCAGSAIRFTYFHSLYTSSASTPASRQPVPDCLTPPKPMCGSLPCVPPLTTTTPACTASAKRMARCRLAVWIAEVSPYGEWFTSASASSRSRTR